MIRCPLCGAMYEASNLTCHASCPLGSHCHLVCCPHCGYEMPDDSRSPVMRWIKRFTAKKGHRNQQEQPLAPAPVIPLVAAPVGTRMAVRGIDGLTAKQIARFSVLGLLPGAHVELVQRRPTPVVRIGETEIAVGASIAAQIQVQPDAEGPKR